MTPMSKPAVDSLVVAAERWGLAAIRYTDKRSALPTARMVAAKRCVFCKRWVAYGRSRQHMLGHLKGTPLT